MLRMVSNEELSRQAILVPYVESLVARVFGRGSLSGVAATLLEVAPTMPAPGWIVLTDAAGMGVALCPRDVVPGRTPLRSRIEYARYAARVAALFESGPARLTIASIDQASCPEDWRVYQVQVGGDEAVCAVSYPPPPIGSDFTPLQRSPRRVRLSLRGWCSFPEEGDRGVSVEHDAIRVRVEKIEQLYELRIGKEGTMIVTPVEDKERAESIDSLGVRLDLGEIEIGLEELVALRAGSSIELASEVPLRCFLRIGVTTLAAGEITIHGDKLLIRVTEALSDE